MGLNCSSYCTEEVSQFSGRHKKNGTKHVTEDEIRQTLMGTENLFETKVSLVCFDNGEFIIGLGLTAEINRHPDGQLTYTGYKQGADKESQILWTRTYPKIAAILYMVDSNDRQKIKSSKTELRRFFKEESFQEFYLLIFCNGDLEPNAMDVQEIERKLRLKKLKNCINYRVQPVVGSKGCGFQYGLAWLSDMLENRNLRNNLSL